MPTGSRIRRSLTLAFVVARLACAVPAVALESGARVLFNPIRDDLVQPVQVNDLPCNTLANGASICAPGGIVNVSSREHEFYLSFRGDAEHALEHAGLWLGSNNLRAITFEPDLKKPELVLYWDHGTRDQGDSMKVYLRLPLHYTKEQFRAWCNEEGARAWAAILRDYHEVLEANPATSSYRRPITMDMADCKLMYAPNDLRLSNVTLSPAPAPAPAPDPAGDSELMGNLMQTLSNGDWAGFQNQASQIHVTDANRALFQSVLGSAVYMLRPQYVRALLDAGVPPLQDTQMSASETAAILVSAPSRSPFGELESQARRDILQMLIDHGLDVRAPDSSGLTLLDHAILSYQIGNASAATLFDPLQQAGVRSAQGLEIPTGPPGGGATF